MIFFDISMKIFLHWKHTPIYIPLFLPPYYSIFHKFAGLHINTEIITIYIYVTKNPYSIQSILYITNQYIQQGNKWINTRYEGKGKEKSLGLRNRTTTSCSPWTIDVGWPMPGERNLKYEMLTISVSDSVYNPHRHIYQKLI